jgi:hypothetical protein
MFYKGTTMVNKNIISLLPLTFLLFLTTSCDTTNPPDNGKLMLTAEDASCTEAWLNLKSDNITLPAKVNIIKNDSTIITANINSPDTTLYIENLLPKKTYTFQTIIQSTDRKSNSISVTTMDTTSHNFTWETYTFGGVNGSSYLKDVAIINENNIWAVGEIHTAETDQFDSNGVWVKPYNAVHWDGNNWELKRILYNNNFWAINTILAFSDNDIWFDVFVHWNGSSFSNDAIPNVLMGWRSNSLWGTSSKDFYVVGNGGNIAHYENGSWTKIESGTELDIRDIYGSFDFNTGEEEILCIASNKYFNEGSELIQVKDDKIIKLSKKGLPWSLSNIWFIKNRKYFIAGDGLYSSLSLDDVWNEEKGSPRLYKNAVRGTNLNNIVVSGAYGLLSHFNGLTWYHYVYAELSYLSGSYNAVDINDRIIVTVGFQDTRAILVIGKK